MLDKNEKATFNQMIESLPTFERNNFLAHCEDIELEFGKILCEPNQPIQYVYFPLTGIVSLVTSLRGHNPLEMTMIGNEGMLGATLGLGIHSLPMRAIVRGTGRALRMKASELSIQLSNIPEFAMRINRYLYVMIAQISHNAACTHFHATEPRLARWLLMMHDRARVDRLHLTHSFLADMLGVRRSSITIAAGALQNRKLISYMRGEITILDHKGLEAFACDCYKTEKIDYSRFFT